MKMLLSFVIIGLSLLLMPIISFAAEKIGIVIFASGTSYSLNTDNQKNDLKRGSDILAGDTVMTGADGQLQFRLNDNSTFAVKPNSKIVLADFQYQFKNKDNKSIIKLIEGGFRTVTGAVASENPDHYSVQTPVAVIGVRGTDFTLVYEHSQLYATVWSGTICITNSAGTICIGAGQQNKSAATSSNNTPPSGLKKVPPSCQLCQ